MDYNQPFGKPANDPYITGSSIPPVEGSSPPGEAIEYPQREIVNAIIGAGLAPDNGDLTQLLQAIQVLGQKWAKGADIASASPLVLGTDGNFFVVTGVIGFAGITVAINRFFMLEFDDALTMTHGAALDLPGGINITTEAGGRLIGFSTAANTVVVLSYTSPSVFFRNHIAGLELSKSAADTLAIAAGEARDDSNAADMNIAAFTKDVSAAWAVGTGNGSLDTGAYAASTLYYVWLMRRSDTGLVDVLTSLSGTNAGLNKPANYDAFRLIGAFVTDATPDILAFQQVGDHFQFMGVSLLDISDASITKNTVETGSLSVPRHSLAHVNASVTLNSGGSAGTSMELFLVTNGAAETTTMPEAWVAMDDNNSIGEFIGKEGTVLVDGSSQVRYTADHADAGSVLQVRVYTLGFTMLTRSNPI